MAGTSHLMRRLGHALTLLLFLGAATLLYYKVRHHDWDKVLASLRATPPSQIIASIVLMVVNYGILVGYDWLALRAIGRHLPWYRVVLVSFVGHTTSYNFGALLGGTTVRYRLYSSWGLTGGEIVRLVAMLAVTFWFGVFALAGSVFVLDPITIPPELGLPGGSVRTLGWVLLAMTSVYLATVFLWRKPLRWRSHELRLPGPAIAVSQLVVAAVDLAAAAGCAFALMPATLDMPFPIFLSIYLLAIVSVVFSHVPGGAGVLELTILTFLGQSDEQVVAAILLFRVVYYLLPLFVAALAWGAYELLRRRRPAEATLGG